MTEKKHPHKPVIVTLYPILSRCSKCGAEKKIWSDNRYPSWRLNGKCQLGCPGKEEKP